jgi:hypothetical protein
MNRRSFLSALIIAPAGAALLAACGDDSTDDADEDNGDDNGGDNGGGGIDYQRTADTAVLRLGSEGGFVPAFFAFVNQPSLLISGDGLAYTPGAVAEIYPGPLVLPMGVRTISDRGIQSVLRLADEAGLLAPPPDYFAEVPVADAPDTVLTINAAGGSFRHQANALGFQIDENGNPKPEPTKERQKLWEFVQLMGDMAKVVGAEELGAETIWAPTGYRLQAREVTDDEIAAVEGATVVDWPDAADVRLADALECAQSSDNAVATALTEAFQNTFFAEAGTTYAVSAAGVLPGEGC